MKPLRRQIQIVVCFTVVVMQISRGGAIGEDEGGWHRSAKVPYIKQLVEKVDAALASVTTGTSSVNPKNVLPSSSPSMDKVVYKQCKWFAHILTPAAFNQSLGQSLVLLNDISNLGDCAYTQFTSGTATVSIYSSQDHSIVRILDSKSQITPDNRTAILALVAEFVQKGNLIPRWLENTPIKSDWEYLPAKYSIRDISRTDWVDKIDPHLFITTARVAVADHAVYVWFPNGYVSAYLPSKAPDPNEWFSTTGVFKIVDGSAVMNEALSGRTSN